MLLGEPEYESLSEPVTDDALDPAKVEGEQFGKYDGSQRMGYLRRRDAVLRQRVRIWVGWGLEEG